MERKVIIKEEVYAAIREFRLLRMEDVKAVVMELNGELNVVKKNETILRKQFTSGNPTSYLYSRNNYSMQFF